MNGISMVATSPGPNWVSHIVFKVFMTIYPIKFWNWVFLCMPPQNHKISIRVSQKQTWQSLKFSVRQDSPVGVNPVDITGYQVSNKNNKKFCFSSLPSSSSSLTATPPLSRRGRVWQSLLYEGNHQTTQTLTFSLLSARSRVFLIEHGEWSLNMLDRHVFASNG